MPRDSPLRAQLDELTQRILANLQVQDLHKLEIAIDLHTIERLGLYRLVNEASITSFAFNVLGMASSTSSEHRAIGRACHESSDFQAALRSGELGWWQGHELLSVIDGPGPRGEPPGREAVKAWVERVRGLSIDETREVVSGVRLYRRLYKWTGPQLADQDLTLRLLRRELGKERTKEELLAALFHRFNTGALVAAGSQKRAPYQIAIRACVCGEKGERPSSAGPIPVPRAEVERMLERADILDEGTGRVTRAVPAASSRVVGARAGWRCSVPACFNPAIDDHHELGRENGHDPAHRVPLCRAHHGQRHDGLLRVEGIWPEVHYYSWDGTYLGRACDTERAEHHRPETGRSSKTVVDRAVKALVKLELKGREAKALVSRVLVDSPGRDWSAGELIEVALKALAPSAGITISPGPAEGCSASEGGEPAGAPIASPSDPEASDP